MAHPDLNRIFDSLLPLAKQLLKLRGEFFPFASKMLADGEIVSVSASNGDEHSPSQPLIDLLAQAFQVEAHCHQIRAAGICYDVRIIPPGQIEKCDAICVGLEHVTGEAVDVFVPYRKNEPEDISYGEIFATRRTKQFFVQGTRTA